MKRVLDAGCGRGQVYVDFGDAYIVGVDIDEDALASNAQAAEKIVADISTYQLPPRYFDAAICWDTLEHVANPRRVLSNIVDAVQPGGTIVLGFPNVASPKGLVTKLTPHWFHIWVYRHVFHNRNAGTTGFGPYRTYLRWSMRPSAMQRFAQRIGAEVEELRLESPPAEMFVTGRWRRRIVRWLVRESECRMTLRIPSAG